jgi:hypothetical protein
LEGLEVRVVPSLTLSLQEAGVNGGVPTVVAAAPDFTAASFTGTYGDFGVTIDAGSSDNGAAQSDLLSSTNRITNLSSTSTLTLKLTVFQDGYTLPAGSPVNVESGQGGSVNTGTLSLSNIFQAFASSTNNTTFDFTNGPQTATQTGSTFQTGSATGVFSRAAGPYALSSTVTITLTPGGTINFSSHVNVTPSTPVQPGTFATIGFWHNKNGQAVINSFNGSSDSTALGTWLSSNFGNLFGGLAGQTNAQIASAYQTAFGNVGGVQGNTYAQAFAVALGVYADTPGLGFNATAAKFGFIPVPGGGASLTFNVGNDGAAFGVPNNTVLTVGQILTIVNANFDPVTGLFYGGDQAKTSSANDVHNGINTTGDIP